MSQFPKSKVYLEFNRHGGGRPITPISARLREIDLSELKVLEDTAADFRMTLDKYPHFWKFSRWLAEYSKEQLDARPIPPRRRKTNGDKALVVCRTIWQNRIDACKMHMERLLEGHMRMLQLQVVALAQYTDKIITSELKQLPCIGHKIADPSTIQVLSGGSTLTSTLHTIKAEERAVAPLPLRAPELVQMLHERVHRSQIKCKKLEDRIYPSVLRYRKRLHKLKMARKRNHSMGEMAEAQGELASTRSIPQPSNTNGAKHTVAPNSDDRLEAIRAWSLTGMVGQRHSYYTTRLPLTKQHHRRLSYSHRHAAPDSPSSSSLSPPKEAKVDDPFESLSSAFSSFLEDTYLGHRPDSPAEEANVGYTADDVQLLFHQNQFRDTRQYFGRKRRVGLQRLQEMAESVATLRRQELKYLDDAVELSDLVCIELMLQCAHVNPAAWKLQLERSAGHAGPYTLQLTDMWSAMWYVDKIDDVAVQNQIKRLRWRVLRWSRKAKIGDEEANKRLQKVMEMLQEKDRGTWAFRMMKARLEEMVAERLRSETRGWQRRRYQQALKKLLIGEIAYLREAITASERNLEIMGKMLFFIQQGAKEESDRQKVAMENVRRTLPKRTLERVNEAWTLANELEELLSSR